MLSEVLVSMPPSPDGSDGPLIPTQGSHIETSSTMPPTAATIWPCDNLPISDVLLDRLRAPAGGPYFLRQPDAGVTTARARAAFTVFTSSIAIVIGPTPPGTGVIAPATCFAASKSTSPTNPSSVRFVPTSITVAPGRTMSAV